MPSSGNNPDTAVLAEHLRIEARLAEGNPPQEKEQAEHAKTTFLRFRQWLAERDQAEAAAGGKEGTNGPGRFPSFREWVAQHPAE